MTDPSAAATVSSATVHEASGRRGALPAAIKPVDQRMYLQARAFPVRVPAGDNLWLHRAVYAAQPGDVLVVDDGGGHEYGYWGEVLSAAAIARGLAGLVITGGVRDALRLSEMPFPVFAGCISIRGTGKDPDGDGWLGEPVRIGDVTVSRGDLVVGDADGVVCIPADESAAVLAASVARDREESRILGRLAAGEATLDIYKLR